jgi:hypothetical protein
MEASVARRAVDAASSTGLALGLQVDDAVIVNNGGRIAVRLMPCDVLAMVAPSAWQAEMQFEVDVARRLAGTDSPAGQLEPRAEARVYLRDDFAITLWTYYAPATRAEHVDISVAVDAFKQSHIAPADYAHALCRLHDGFRQIDLAAPHVSSRIADWARHAADPGVTPDLLGSDRELLCNTLERASTAIERQATNEQLLHGEPHSGNVLSTKTGPRFIDLGTCQRGPVEYDLSYAPVEVSELYPGADQDLVHLFRIIMWAGVTTTRWYRNDQFPNRDYWRVEGLKELRAMLDG